MITERTTSELRKTGINVIGDVRWGTHFCYFYETQQDLLETLVLYFKAGFEHGEFCLWVVPEFLTVAEAEQALRQAVPDLDRHRAEGDLEIYSHHEWYLRNGEFDSEGVLQAWSEKLDQTLAKGFAGLRASGDGGWIRNDDRMNFREYERQVDALIADKRSIILCTYPLATSSGGHVFDVACIHQVAAARRNGSWDVVETPALKEAKAGIKRLNEELEEKVAKRTRELRATNEELRKEITERKQIERELREGQQQYESLVHSIDGVVWEVDAATFRFTFVSKQAERILGYPLAQWLEPSFWADHLHPEDRNWAVGFCLDATQRGVDHQFEYRMIAADGRVVWLRDHVTMDVRMDQSVRLRGVMFDITQRKELEQQSRALIDAIPHQIWSGPADGTLDYCNERWRAYMGQEQKDLSGDGWQRMLHPEDRDRVLKAWQQSVLNGTPYETEERHRGADGEYRWFLSRGVPMRDAGGHIIRWYRTNTDIEDRKRAEKELRESETRFRQLAENIEEVFWMTDYESAKTIYVSPAYERIWGRSCANLYSNPKAWREAIHPEEREGMPKTVPSQMGRVTDKTYRVVRPDGTIRWIRDREFPVRDESGRIVRMAGIAQDITQSKEVAEELEKANQQLRILSQQLFHLQEEERRHLARELHDEIGQTLTAAKINLKIITPDVPANVAGRLDDSVQLLDLLLRQVRRLSLDLRPPLLDELGLVPTLRWLVDQQSQRAGLRISFKTNVNGLEIEPTIQTTCFRVAQEAITNIIRHSGAKTVTIVLRRKAGRLWLKVRDDGAGFDPGKTEHRSGLGMVSMKERMLLVRGGLEVRSRPRKGTEIQAWFPLDFGQQSSRTESS